MSMSGKAVAPYYYWKQWDYCIRNLLGKMPPASYMNLVSVMDRPWSAKDAKVGIRHAHAHSARVALQTTGEA